jgi:hypothetical protein
MQSQKGDEDFVMNLSSKVFPRQEPAFFDAVPVDAPGKR